MQIAWKYLPHVKRTETIRIQVSRRTCCRAKILYNPVTHTELNSRKQQICRAKLKTCVSSFRSPAQLFHIRCKGRGKEPRWPQDQEPTHFFNCVQHICLLLLFNKVWVTGLYNILVYCYKIWEFIWNPFGNRNLTWFLSVVLEFCQYH